MAARSKPSSRPAGKALVIVESPAKARTLARFLGDDYAVQASIGHIRDLPSRSSDLPPELKKTPHGRLGVDIEGNFEPLYVVPPEKKEQIRILKRLLKDASSLWLATDEDREGEAISWHLREVLKPKVPTHRLVFHEITREAIAHALTQPRDIDENLVQAQETRRILDRLYGYEISPVLWRKIRTGLSAGRVQSVALRLLVDREQSRIEFRSAEYWDLLATFGTGKDGEAPFETVLVELGDKRVATGRDFDPKTGESRNEDATVLDEAGAKALVERLAKAPAAVKSVEEKPYTKRPAPPFTTSTLQQEAGRKLRFSARRTMQVAQILYENGVITYMRTDSTALSAQAIEGARTFIRDNYDAAYLPDRPRHYRTKVKNAQEAHEAIRPAGSAFLAVDEVRRAHGPEAAALYNLIWMRTVASQMPDARGRRVSLRIAVDDAQFRATGKTILFPGFQRAYVEGSDDPVGDLADQDSLLPPLEEGQALTAGGFEAQGHTTQPPARYSDASLVKELDQRGIGRPSTWAAIIGVLLDREYAFRKSSALVPTWTGFAVVRMLKQTFGSLLDYEFTARLEDDLDAVSRGEGDGRAYLKRFYLGNGEAGLRQLVQAGIDDVDPREACRFVLGQDGDRTIEIRVGKYGLFLTDGEANASLPEQSVPDELTLEGARELLAAAAAGPQVLGEHPDEGLPVYLKNGPYGPYVQLGEQGEKGTPKPKMVSLLRGMTPEGLTLETALKLLSLPRTLGPHPDDQEPVLALTGRYGPFVKWGKESRSIPDDVNVLEIGLERALALLKEPRRRGRGSTPETLHDVGEHPTSGKPLKVLKGRYGPYVSDGEINASLPRAKEPTTLTLEEAVDLLERRAERLRTQGPRRKKKAAPKRKAKAKAKKKAAPKTKAKAKKKATSKAKPKAKKKAASKKATPKAKPKGA